MACVRALLPRSRASLEALPTVWHQLQRGIATWRQSGLPTQRLALATQRKHVEMPELTKRNKRLRDKMFAKRLENTRFEGPGTDMKEYRIWGGCVIERNPVIVPDPEPWESHKDVLHPQYMEWRDMEPTLYNLSIGASEGKSGAFYDDLENLPPPPPAGQPDPVEFRPAPRITEDDVKNNRKSTNRRLQHRLFLIVRTPQGWQFPMAAWKEGETVRQTAERSLAEQCGKATNTYTISNAPIGHYARPFAQPDKDGRKGDMIFLLHLLVLPENQITVDGKNATDYLWVAKDELPEYFAGNAPLLSLCKSMVMH